MDRFPVDSMLVSMGSWDATGSGGAYIVLWADWSSRTFEGRGVNFIEGISPCVHDIHNSTRQLTKSLKDWEERLGWEETRRTNEDKPFLPLDTGVCEKRKRRTSFESLFGTESPCLPDRLEAEV